MPGSRAALRRAAGKLLRGREERQKGQEYGGDALGKVGMSERAITGRVKYLGKQIGVAGLSAHDLRHSWATRTARNHTDLKSLKDAGGCNSLVMPDRYIESARIANEGVQLGED
ncbi:MAG: tyrosine-type recombinase/integrase [Chloroflexota bacterium]